MKPIAVVTDNIPATFEWLRETCGVDKLDIINRTATNSRTEQTYVLILDKEQACSWEFSGMLVSPFHFSLEQFVRSRVR